MSLCVSRSQPHTRDSRVTHESAGHVRCRLAATCARCTNADRCACRCDDARRRTRLKLSQRVHRELYFMLYFLGATTHHHASDQFQTTQQALEHGSQQNVVFCNVQNSLSILMPLSVSNLPMCPLYRVSSGSRTPTVAKQGYANVVCNCSSRLRKRRAARRAARRRNRSRDAIDRSVRAPRWDPHLLGSFHVDN